MENKTEILKTLSDTFSELEKAIQRFNEATFNEKPPQGNWSPAMVAQHLVLAGTGFDQVLLGNTKETAGEADSKVAMLRDILLNYDLKMNAPAFIEPADQTYKQGELRHQLSEIGKALIAVVPDLDLTPTCLDFELPGIGHITRLEAIWFLIFHTQRHTHQINEMAQQKMA